MRYPDSKDLAHMDTLSFKERRAAKIGCIARLHHYRNASAAKDFWFEQCPEISRVDFKDLVIALAALEDDPLTLAEAGTLNAQ